MKSSLVSIIGPTNSGKSTLINALNKKKISIVSHKVQTTNLNIRANIKFKDSNIIFIDTPGFYSKKNNVNFINTANEAIKTSDIVCVLIDIKSKLDFLNDIKDRIIKVNKPKILIFNKIDLVSKTYVIKKVEKIEFLNIFQDIFYISALKEISFNNFLQYIYKKTKQKKKYNLEKKHTMSKSKFFAEITREAIFRFTNQEIPYQTNVITQKIIKTKSVKIYQNLVVKNKNQQRIIIGKSGKMLKLIGQYSRKQLEEILKSKVHLFLNVIIGN